MRALLTSAILVSVVLGFSGAADARTSQSQPQIRVDLPYSMIVRVLGTDSYQIEVDNTNPTKTVKSFTWTPPSGMTVTAVTSATGGKCDVTGGIISCKGSLGAAPCTCVGGSMLVNFTAKGREPTWANGYWIHYGVVGALDITSSTPVKVPTFSDLPACAKGQKSTKARPCAVT